MYREITNYCEIYKIFCFFVYFKYYVLYELTYNFVIMKITLYNTKGSAGKTPIATNIALERGYAIATNETYHVFDRFIPKERLISVDMNEAFPLFGCEVDVVFDLA